MKLISGSSNLPFAKKLAEHLDLEMLDVELGMFSNGEKRVWIKDPVHGENVIVVQSLSHPTDEHIMETLLITDALERLGARHINLVIPWFGYSFQDKVFRPGEPIAAKVVADLISQSYVKRVLLFDLHNASIPGFFSIPTHHLTALPLFIEYANAHFSLSEAVVVSPDFGGLKRSRDFAERLRLELANINKHRDLHSGAVSTVSLQGNVHGKVCLLMDDAIMSGSTALEVAKLLKQHGAQAVHFLSTHGVFSDDAINKLTTPELDSVIITNSLAHAPLPDAFIELDATPIFAELLRPWM